MYNLWDGAIWSISGSDDLHPCSSATYLLSIPKKAAHSSFSQSNIISLPCIDPQPNLKRTSTCERTCNVQVSYQRIFFMEPPDSSLLRFGERFLSRSSRCGRWFWTEGWHLTCAWKLESRFQTFRSEIHNWGWKCQHEGQTILFTYLEALSMTGPAPMHVEMTYSCPSVFDSNDYYVLSYAITPHAKRSSGIKSQDWVWPLSSLVFSALMVTLGGGNSELYK